MSADIDGEPMPVTRTELQEHLEGCEAAHEVTRRTRLLAADLVADRTEELLTAVLAGPGRRSGTVRGARWWVRAALAAVAVSEVVVSVAATLNDHRYPHPSRELPHGLAMLGWLLLYLLTRGESGGESPRGTQRGSRRLSGPNRMTRWFPSRWPGGWLGGPRWTRVAGRRVWLRAGVVGSLGMVWLLGALHGIGHATMLPATHTTTHVAIHAELVHSSPQAGARLASAPPEVVLEFTEPVLLVDHGIRLLDAAGRDSPLTRPTRHGARVTVPLPRLGEGGYVLAWRVVSVDSHPVSGAIPFAVGNAQPPASDAAPPAGQGNTAARVLLGIARWIGFAGLVLVAGPLAFALLCWPGAHTDRQTSLLMRLGLALVAIVAVVSIPVQGVNMTGRSLTAALDPDVLEAAVRTTFGMAALVRLALAAALWALLSRITKNRWTVASAMTLIAGILVTVSVSGHSWAARPLPVAVGADAVHLAAMAGWVGGLVVIALLLLPRSGGEELRTALPRWSRWAMTCVAVLAATGVYQAWREIGSFDALTGTTYGRLLLVKTGCVASLLLLGNFGRLWVRRQSVGAMAVTVRSMTRLRWSVGAEVLIAAIVLAMTAALVATTPGKTELATRTGAQAAPQSAEGVAVLPDGGRVQVSFEPPAAGTPVVHLHILDRQGRPMNALEVTAAASLPERGLQDLPVPLHRMGPGRFAAHGAHLPYPGRWRIAVTIRVSDVDAGVGTATVTLR